MATDARLIPPWAVEFRQVVEVARQQGATLRDIHRALAFELGRTSANLDDEQTLRFWLHDVVGVALTSWRLERAELAEAVARNLRPRARRARR